jgi:hypothetical protein
LQPEFAQFGAYAVGTLAAGGVRGHEILQKAPIVQQSFDDEPLDEFIDQQAIVPFVTKLSA